MNEHGGYGDCVGCEGLIAERDALKAELAATEASLDDHCAKEVALKRQLTELREAAEALAKRWGKHNSRSAQYAEARNQCARDLRALLAKLQPSAAKVSK